jgi:hypothetical protein
MVELVIWMTPLLFYRAYRFTRKLRLFVTSWGSLCEGAVKIFWGDNAAHDRTMVTFAGHKTSRAEPAH